jgi:hypothetical protein
MVRRSDAWVFNIRQHHISYNFSGPGDPTVHDEANVDQPWFGKSSQAQPEMRSGDLVIVRRTSRGGDQPAGVVGLWKFSSTRYINSPDQIPWDDKDYTWAIYCRPVQHRIEPVYTEDWDNLPFSYRQLQSEVISLPPSDAFAYLCELLKHGALSESARQVIKQRYQFETGIEIAVGDDEPSSESIESRRKTTEVDSRLRDDRLVRELKNTYDDRCQVCGNRRKQGRSEAYSEVHHIKPLGRPHSGPDEKLNMLVLCPNHHVDFDNGVIAIDPKTGTLVHPFDDVRTQLMIEESHSISKKHYRYHLEELAIEETAARLE